MRDIRPAAPKLTLAEARRILAVAVLGFKEDKRTHQEYRESVASIRAIASQMLQHDETRKREPSEMEIGERAGKRRKEEQKEILVPVQERPGPCPCTNCGKQCHIPGLNLAHPCPHCNKSFQKTSHLRSHLHVHSSVRTHTCTECAAQFKRHDQLVRHLYTHDTDSAKQRFRCRKCKSTFTRKDNFKMHLKRKFACRTMMKDGKLESVMEVLESGKNSVIVKPPRVKNRDRKTSLAELASDNRSEPQQGNKAVLVPVTRNKDGTLTVTGDAINIPSTSNMVTADTIKICPLKNKEELPTVTVSKEPEIVSAGSPEPGNSEVSAPLEVSPQLVTCDKDLYDEPARTPTDIVALDTNYVAMTTQSVALDTNLPITDQIAYQRLRGEQVTMTTHNVPTVVVDSGLGYQTEFSNVELGSISCPEEEVLSSVLTSHIASESHQVSSVTMETTERTATNGSQDVAFCCHEDQKSSLPPINSGPTSSGCNSASSSDGVDHSSSTVAIGNIKRNSSSLNQPQITTVSSQVTGEITAQVTGNSHSQIIVLQVPTVRDGVCEAMGSNPQAVSEAVGSNPQAVSEVMVSSSQPTSEIMGSSPQAMSEEMGSSPQSMSEVMRSSPQAMSEEMGSSPQSMSEAMMSIPEIIPEAIRSNPMGLISEAMRSNPQKAISEATGSNPQESLSKQVSQAPEVAEQTEQPTDILSQVIENLLADTGPTTQEQDDQIINVMKGGHTITSTPPRTKSAMDLLRAVVFMNSRISEPVRPVESSSSAESVLAEEPGVSSQPGVIHQDEKTERPDYRYTALKCPENSPKDPVTPDKRKTPRKKTPRKTPRTGKTRSPKSQTLKIVNPHKSENSGLVKQIFRARKRLFSDREDAESEPHCKLTKLETGVLGRDVLEQNDKLRAAALGDTVKITPHVPTASKDNITEQRGSAEERGEGAAPPATPSPLTGHLIGDSPVNRDAVLSPISPLRASSPFHELSQFLFPPADTPHLLNSPFPSPHIISGPSSPLFLHDRALLRPHTPDSSLLRPHTPERGDHSPDRGILQTPDHSRMISNLSSFEQDEQAFEDNFIWRELEHMFTGYKRDMNEVQIQDS